MKSISVDKMLNSIIPISRFNKGEANKIFDEVDKTGIKIVVKNNNPSCVLISPQKYKELMEEIEDCHLYLEAERRMQNESDKDYIPQDEIYKEFGITKEEIDNMEDVELE